MTNHVKNKLCKLRSRAISGMLVLALAVGMTGCAGEADNQEITEPQAEKAAVVSDGELKADSTVVAVGNTKVLYNEYQIYSWFLKNQYEEIMSEKVWEYSLGDVTVGQIAIEDILRLIIQIKVMNRAAEEQNIKLEVDEKEDIDYKADQYLATIPEDVQQANGITTEAMHRIFEGNEVARKMYDVITGNVQAGIDENAMQAAKVLLLHLPADDSNREEVRSKITALSGELESYSGNFYSFVKEKTGKAPEEMIIGRMDSRSNLVNTALTMNRYSISGVVEETDGFYIIYSLKVNTKGLNKVYREQYIMELQNTTFQAAYENWAQKYEVKVSKSLLAN